jgi:hypothetical protein
MQLFLGFADHRDFRIGVNHRRNGVVIHVPGAARDDFRAGDSLVFRLVRQHRAFAYVADGPDVLYA